MSISPLAKSSTARRPDSSRLVRGPKNKFDIAWAYRSIFPSGNAADSVPAQGRAPPAFADFPKAARYLAYSFR